MGHPHLKNRSESNVQGLNCVDVRVPLFLQNVLTDRGLTAPPICTPFFKSTPPHTTSGGNRTTLPAWKEQPHPPQEPPKDGPPPPPGWTPPKDGPPPPKDGPPPLPRMDPPQGWTPKDGPQEWTHTVTHILSAPGAWHTREDHPNCAETVNHHFELSAVMSIGHPEVHVAHEEVGLPCTPLLPHSPKRTLSCPNS